MISPPHWRERLSQPLDIRYPALSNNSNTSSFYRLSRRWSRKSPQATSIRSLTNLAEQGVLWLGRRMGMPIPACLFHVQVVGEAYPPLLPRPTLPPHGELAGSGTKDAVSVVITSVGRDWVRGTHT